jgi:hypothetical protein
MTYLYWSGFKKHFDEKSIHQNADQVVMVDVKNIRNYFIFSYLKNPSQWKWDSKTVNTNELFGLSNFGLKTPDYVALFHIENQPQSVFYCVAEIQTESFFEKAITKEHFSKSSLKNGMVCYYSKALKLFIIKHSNQILFVAIPEKEKETALKIAEDLFLKKKFLDAVKIQKTIDTPNAITLWIKKNCFLEQDGIVTIQLQDDEIVAEAQLQLKPKYLTKTQFSQNPNALLSLGFDSKMFRDHKIITQNSIKINKTIGFDLDSILSQNPTKTELVLNGIIEKKDSAISYSYDDDFNAVEKTVVHITREPSFYFSMQSSNSRYVFNYLKSQKVINNEHIFVNFPLAKTTASVAGNNFVLKANLFDYSPKPSSGKKIAYLQVNFNKLQPKDWSFIIRKNKNFKLLKHFESLQMNLNEENNSGIFRASLKTKNNKNLSTVFQD